MTTIALLAKLLFWKAKWYVTDGRVLSTEKVLVNNAFPNIFRETVKLATGTTPLAEIWRTPSYAPTLRRLAGIWDPYVMVPVVEIGIMWEANTFI